jgi:RNA 3'-terminal phosphate cyclase (ATP)
VSPAVSETHTVVSQLPLSIAQRELDVIGKRLSLTAGRLSAIEETRSPGPGNIVSIEIESEHVTEVVTGFGKKGIATEIVAQTAADEAAAYLDSGVPVGTHLADQLLLPMVLGDGGQFVTMPPSDHTSTNIEVIRRFVERGISVTPAGENAVRIEVLRP